MKKLDPSNIAEIRDAIVEACKGKKIRTGAFGVEYRFGPIVPLAEGCCPLGALACGIDNRQGAFDALAQRGLPAQWVNSFWMGFDGREDLVKKTPSIKSSWSYMLGRHFKQLYDRGALGVQE